MKTKKLISCLLIMCLTGTMTAPVYAAEKRKEADTNFDMYSSYAPGEKVPENDNTNTEDAPSFRMSKRKKESKIGKKDKKNIKKLCSRFSDYLGYSVGRQKLGKTVSLDFKKLKTRKKVLGFMPDLLYTKGQSLESASKLVFGRKVSGEITVTHINWGDNKNIVKITDIIKKKGNRYEAKFDLLFYRASKNTKTKFAKGSFYLKKTGKYNYVATGLKVKKTKN